MKGSEKAIFIGVGVLALAAVFYLMVLSPQRQKASDLQDQISSLQASISQENQTADYGEQARQHFPVYYGRLVVLGKAVPEQADTASMLVQLSSIAQRTHLDFGGIKLGSDTSGSGTGSSSASSTAAPTAPTSTGTSGSTGSTTGSTGSSTAPTSTTGSSSSTPASSTSSSSTSSSSAAPTATAVPATESAVASQPLGAVVGPSGLPTLPYTLTFKGGFFDVANFIGGLDGLVDLHHASGQVGADGRLMTVDGFTLSGGQPGSNPSLSGSFVVTTYVAPPGQGLTAGASPTAPAPAPPVSSQPQTTPTSSSIGQ